MCDIDKDEYEFMLKDPKRGKCTKNYFHSVIFKWKSSNTLAILEKRFNFTNARKYFGNLTHKLNLKFWNLKGFDANFLDDNLSNNSSLISSIELSNCRLELYHNNQKINSCQNFVDLNLTRIGSIFQIRFDNSDFDRYFKLRSVEYKRNMCPFLFQNTNLYHLLLNDILETFYKKNILSFSNETFTDLNSYIRFLELHNLNNINLDVNLLHPSVFSKLEAIVIVSGSLKSIDDRIFKQLNNFLYMEINSIIFRKINHKQGI